MLGQEICITSYNKLQIYYKIGSKHAKHVSNAREKEHLNVQITELLQAFS